MKTEYGSCVLRCFAIASVVQLKYKTERRKARLQLMFHKSISHLWISTLLFFRIRMFLTQKRKSRLPQLTTWDRNWPRNRRKWSTWISVCCICIWTRATSAKKLLKISSLSTQVCITVLKDIRTWLSHFLSQISRNWVGFQGLPTNRNSLLVSLNKSISASSSSSAFALAWRNYSPRSITPPRFYERFCMPLRLGANQGYWPSDSIFDQGGVHHKLLVSLNWMGSFACHCHRHQVQGTSVLHLIRRTRAIEVKQLAQGCKQTWQWRESNPRP
jgi:hypothetical protein